MGGCLQAGTSLPYRQQRRRRRGKPSPRPETARSSTYLISTEAPASSSWALIVVGLFLGTPSLTGCGRRVDEVLGLLEAEAGDRADDLDHLDLLLAGAGEDDVERRLLLGRRAAAAAAAGRPRPRPERRR